MKVTRFCIILCALLLAALACNTPQNSAAPSPDIEKMVAQTQTAAAVQQVLATTAVPLQQNIPQPSAQTAVATTLPPTEIPPTPITPTVTNPPQCKDKAEFVSETIPDNTVFNPGTPFVKTWHLKNAGGCTWTAGYALALVQGEGMSGTDPLLFNATVPPGSTIELKLPQTAPSDPGEHAGYWKLRNDRGQDFGNLWVKITVAGSTSSGGSSQNLGSPTWIDSFSDGAASFDLGSDSSTKYQVKDGNLIITALSSQGDQWRISNKSYPDNFYVESRFVTGDKCSGKDSYGMIVRAPDQPNSIIDSAYVFIFSCEGKYRIYLMNQGQYLSLQNWTASAAIKSGPGQNNVMGIKAKDDLFELYANGTLLFQFNDTTYSIGYLGLVIRSDVTSNFQIAVNEISFWDLP